MSGEGKGELQKRIQKWKDDQESGNIEASYKSPEEIEQWIDEFRREIPYRHTEGHTYIDPVKLPEVIRKWLGEEQK